MSAWWRIFSKIFEPHVALVLFVMEIGHKWITGVSLGYEAKSVLVKFGFFAKIAMGEFDNH